MADIRQTVLIIGGLIDESGAEQISRLPGDLAGLLGMEVRLPRTVIADYDTNMIAPYEIMAAINALGIVTAEPT